MNNLIKTILSLLTVLTSYEAIHAQGLKMENVIIVGKVSLKEDVKADAFQDYFTKKIAPSWNSGNPEATVHLLRGDRGNRKGEFLFCKTATKNLITGNPFSDPRLSNFLNDYPYTEYQLLGAEKFTSLRTVGILGIHYIKVKPERSKDFEKFVIAKLHPAVGELLPDMQLLYYKAIAGDNVGSYITIFAIESTEARDKYWPSGAPETEVLKQTFKPLGALASELGTFLIEGSYLEPKHGAAAFFESKEWTDFINQGY